VFYVLNAASLANAHHAQAFAERGLAWVYDPVLIEAIRQNAAEARACLERGDLAAGEHHARAALAINSHHADSLHCLAQIETAAGRYPAALGLMRHALAVDDRVPAFFATIAEILLHLGQPGEAAKVRALAVTRFVTHHRAPP
jgi:predicted Zn-dependent protease